MITNYVHVGFYFGVLCYSYCNVFAYGDSHYIGYMDKATAIHRYKDIVAFKDIVID